MDVIISVAEHIFSETPPTLRPVWKPRILSLEFPGIWSPKGPVPVFQTSGAYILMIVLLLGWEISALIGKKRNLLIQCLGFILATLK